MDERSGDAPGAGRERAAGGERDEGRGPGTGREGTTVERRRIWTDPRVGGQWEVQALSGPRAREREAGEEAPGPEHYLRFVRRDESYVIRVPGEVARGLTDLDDGRLQSLLDRAWSPPERPSAPEAE